MGGKVTAASRFEALTMLQTKGLTVVDITSAETGILGLKVVSARVKKGRLVRRITSTEKAIFCRQLAISVNAGIPLREAFEAITLDLDNEVFRATLNRVLQKMNDGGPFSQAIAGEPKVFDHLFVALIKSAEESGSLGETLEYLATMVEKSDRLSRKIRSILAYPLFVVGFFSLISVLMTLFVLPKFQQMFSGRGSSLPPLTKMVFAVNGFMVHNFLFIFVGIAGIVAAIYSYGRTSAGRLKLDGLMLKFPLAGEIIKKLAVARFCRNFGILISGGVPVTMAIEIATEVLGNKVMEDMIKAARDRIMAGNSIASSLDKDVFPRLVSRMVGVGESSGRLPEVLAKVSDVYEEQAEGKILMAISLFEPVIISVFGAMILLLVLAIYLPVFSSSGQVQ